MTSVLLLSLTLASPYPEAFWSRDLGSLAQLVGAAPESGRAMEHAVHRDLLALLSCAPLDELKPSDAAYVERTLIRAEAARRERLGASAQSLPTFWRDVLDESFFRREVPALASREVLQWPIEDEGWPAEVAHVPPPKSACTERSDTSHRSELELSHEALAAVAASPYREQHAALMYVRALLAEQRGELGLAMRDAERIKPEHLPPPLVPHARFLRARLGIGDSDELLALAENALLEDAQPAALAKASEHLLDESQTGEVLKLLDAQATVVARAPEPWAGYLAYARARALDAEGRSDELVHHARAHFGRDMGDGPYVEAVRQMVLWRLAALPFGEGVISALQELSPPDAFQKLLRAVGHRALAMGNVQAASDIARRMSESMEPSARWAGVAVGAELAFVRRDARAFEAALGALVPQDAPSTTKRQDDARELAALELCQRLMDHLVARDDAAWRKRLRQQLERLEATVHKRRRVSVLRMLQALDGKRPEEKPDALFAVAVGEVNVRRETKLLPAPAASVPWKEPHSMLALRDLNGGVKSWFDARPKEMVHAP